MAQQDKYILIPIAAFAAFGAIAALTGQTRWQTTEQEKPNQLEVIVEKTPTTNQETVSHNGTEYTIRFDENGVPAAISYDTQTSNTITMERN